MTTTGLEGFDTTIHQTNLWLKEINEEMGWGDRQYAYHALRAVLHVIRDRLVPDEAADFAAQLPMLIRGFFYDGYKPSRTPTKIRNREEFIAAVSDGFEIDHVDPEAVTRAVFAVLDLHVTQGELEQVRRMMPKDIQKLWLEAVAGA